MIPSKFVYPQEDNMKKVFVAIVFVVFCYVVVDLVRDAAAIRSAQPTVSYMELTMDDGEVVYLIQTDYMKEKKFSLVVDGNIVPATVFMGLVSPEGYSSFALGVGQQRVGNIPLLEGISY